VKEDQENICPNCPVGGAMPEHHLGLLKSLALRPTRSIAVNLAPVVSALQVAGYVSLGPEGWSATAVGCATIEQSRTGGAMARVQNGGYFA
jgi:hypothetical protein